MTATPALPATTSLGTVTNALPAIQAAPALPAPYTVTKYVQDGRKLVPVTVTVSYEYITDPVEIENWRAALRRLIQA